MKLSDALLRACCDEIRAGLNTQQSESGAPLGTCLTSSVILKTALEACGYSATLFTGACQYGNEMFAQFELERRTLYAANMGEGQRRAEELALRSKYRQLGADAVRISANRPDDRYSKADGVIWGHVALFARDNERCFFIDPTSYMLRDETPTNCQPIYIPDFFIEPGDHPDAMIHEFNENPDWMTVNINTTGMQFSAVIPAGTLVSYWYQRLRVLEEIKSDPERLLHSGLHPDRHPELVKRVIGVLGSTSLMESA